MHSIYPTLRPAGIHDLNSKYFVLLVVVNDFGNIVKWLYNVSMHMRKSTILYGKLHAGCCI